MALYALDVVDDLINKGLMEHVEDMSVALQQFFEWYSDDMHAMNESQVAGAVHEFFRVPKVDE